jgi:hypothetical protein
LIRSEINTVHWKRMNRIAKIFNLLFDHDGGEFIFAKNILYYTGGWPFEHTPPRAQTTAYNIADAYIILSFLGEQKVLDKYLKDKGVRIILDDNAISNYFKVKVFANDNYDKLNDLWRKVFKEDLNHEVDEKYIMEQLMVEALGEQSIICKLADEIKINLGDEVKHKCKIDAKSNFTDYVNMNFFKNTGKDISIKLHNTKEHISESSECFTTYKEKLG